MGQVQFVTSGTQEIKWGRKGRKRGEEKRTHLVDKGDSDLAHAFAYNGGGASHVG